MLKREAAAAISRIVTLPSLLKSAHARACRLVADKVFSACCKSPQQRMCPKLRLRSILPPGPSACPPMLPLAFWVHDVCPDIVLTPIAELQNQAALPTMYPAWTGSVATPPMVGVA